MTLAMSIEELNSFLGKTFPQLSNDFEIVDISQTQTVVRLKVGEKHLRPGGTVSGPTMFELVDVAMYIAVLSHIGPVALTVTTNASIDFMRKPQAGHDLLATCRILKLGKVLAVGDVLLTNEGSETPLARANLTYSVPPRG